MIDIFASLVGELDGLAGNVKDRLLKELKSVAAAALVDEAAKVSARALLKGVDAVVAVAVKNLSSEQAEVLAESFVTDAIGEQYDQLQDALKAYVPLQIAVEWAKKQHGSNSGPANAARVARQAGIEELREEVRDILRVATGKSPAD